MDLVIKRIEFGEDHLLEIANLLKLVFKSNHLSLVYLKWLYLENPNGKVVGFNAYGEQIAGMHVNQTFTGVAIGRNLDG